MTYAFLYGSRVLGPALWHRDHRPHAGRRQRAGHRPRRALATAAPAVLGESLGDGGGILGYVASDMILSDRSLARVIEHVAPGRALLPFLPAAGIVALGWWFSAKNGRKGVPGRA